MQHFNNDPDSPRRARTKRALAPNPEPPASQAHLRLTALEATQDFEALRHGVDQEVSPDNEFRNLMANQLAADAWLAQRLSIMHNQALSIQIEEHYDELLKQFPNADAAMHTINAWNRNQSSLTQRYAFTDQTPVTNRYLSLYRTLNSPRRNRKP